MNRFRKLASLKRLGGPSRAGGYAPRQALLWGLCGVLSLCLHGAIAVLLKPFVALPLSKPQGAPQLELLPQEVSAGTYGLDWEDPTPLFLATRWNYACLPALPLSLQKPALPLFLPFPPVLQLEKGGLPQQGLFIAKTLGQLRPPESWKAVISQDLPSIPFFWEGWGKKDGAIGVQDPAPPLEPHWQLQVEWGWVNGPAALGFSKKGCLAPSEAFAGVLAPWRHYTEPLKARAFYHNGLEANFFLGLAGPPEWDGLLRMPALTSQLTACLAGSGLRPGVYDLTFRWVFLPNYL